MIFGVLLLIAGACGITGCSSGGGDGAPATVVTDSGDTVDDSGLPPDPGEAGKATLAGIDFNVNKVRDDMEIAIYERYPTDEQKRDALMRGAYVLQEAMLIGGAILDGTGSRDDAFSIDNKTGLLTECFIDRFGYDSYKEIGFLESLLVNTDDRGRAYDMYNASLNGSVSGLPDTDTPCQDIDL